MSRLNDHNQEIRAQWKQLSSVWEEARSKWRDQAASDFEHQHWHLLEEQMGKYLKSLESLCEGAQHQSS